MAKIKENSLIVELRTFAQLIGEEGRQAEFYRQMLKDAKPIEVVRLSEVFTDTEIKAIKRFVNPKVKECFRNATLFAHIFPEVKYVEGKTNDVGILQITPIYVKDVNRILGEKRYTLSCRTDKRKSLEMFEILQNHYNPDKDIDKAIKLHNSKAPQTYRTKTMKQMEIIKTNLS